MFGVNPSPYSQLMRRARSPADSFERCDDFVLLAEQQVAFNLVRNAVAQAEQAGTSWTPDDKTVVIVRGGPGSGEERSRYRAAS